MLWLLVACQDPGSPPSSPGQPDPYTPPADVGVVPEAVPGAVAPTVLLNELMSDNESTLQRDDETFPDWLELYNPSDESIALDRIAVWRGDDRWIGPEGQELAPRGRLLLYGDEGSADDSLPFTLEADDNKIEITVDGVETDRVETGPLPSDIAAMRVPDGGAWTFGVRPTPGTMNIMAGTNSVDPRDSLFQKDHVTRLDIILSEENYQTLAQNPNDDVEATLVFDGIHFQSVYVHLKGSGSFQGLVSGKSAFKIDLNDIDPDRRMRGLKKLTFNNGITWDPTWTHEWLTYSVFRENGIPAPRVGWTRIHVNGVDYGLYMNVETYDDELLERWFSQPELGTLYEGSGDLTSYMNFHLEEGEPRLEWLAAVSALVQGTPTAEEIDRLDAYVDMDEFRTFAACEAITLQWDGYEAPNNWRLHIDAGDRGRWLPTGVDYTWSYNWAQSVYYGNGDLLQACLTDDGCTTQYSEKVLEVLDVLDQMNLLAEFEDLTAFLADEIATDDRTNHSESTIASAQEETRRLLVEWPAEARQQAMENLGKK